MKLKTGHSKQADENRKVVDAFLAGTHSPDLRDVDIIDETVSPDIVCHGFPVVCPTDRESYKEFFRVFRHSFADMEFKAHAMVAERDLVAVPWQIWVTHKGAYAGVAPTGRRITVEGVAIYRLENGLIAETWLHIDQLALLSQIGAVPALAA